MAHPEQLDPQILSDLVALTREFRAEKECTYLSARMIWEYYRATRYRRIKGDGPLTLNNNLLPLYSRAVMQEPDLVGVFRTRRVRGVDEPEYDEDQLGVTDAELAEMETRAAEIYEEDDQ